MDNKAEITSAVESNVQTRGGQAIDVFSLLIASALVFSIPSVKQATEFSRTKVKSFVINQFDSVRGYTSKADCRAVALNRSPTTGCENTLK